MAEEVKKRNNLPNNMVVVLKGEGVENLDLSKIKFEVWSSVAKFSKAHNCSVSLYHTDRFVYKNSGIISARVEPNTKNIHDDDGFILRRKK